MALPADARAALDMDAVAVADAALALWSQELASRKRTRVTFDALWVAAGATVTAREWVAAGVPRVAAWWYLLARAVVEREATA